jgi:hypothetical protein
MLSFDGKGSTASPIRAYTANTPLPKPSPITDVCEFPHYAAIFFVV